MIYSIATQSMVSIKDAGEKTGIPNDGIRQFPIGFDFPFLGKKYDTMFVSSEGFMTPIPGQGYGAMTGKYIKGAIAAFWRNLSPGG